MLRPAEPKVVFTDSAGIYNPAAQLRSLLTVDQLFRRVYSIQTTHRDTNARRVLLFTVMDTLLTLTGRPLVTHCSLPFARKTLERIQDDMPSTAAPVFIPAAERALVALEKVQDGFFLGRQNGSGSLDLAYSGGGGESLTVSDAAAHYLDVLRNATHGYGTAKSGRVNRTNALVAHHNGGIPHDLGLLGYLYLLDLLANPEILRRILHRASSEK